MSQEPKRWKPWQFSLRTLLLLMFGTACFFGGWTASEWKRQRELQRTPPAATSPDTFTFHLGFAR